MTDRVSFATRFTIYGVMWLLAAAGAIVLEAPFSAIVPITVVAGIADAIGLDRYGLEVAVGMIVVIGFWMLAATTWRYLLLTASAHLMSLIVGITLSLS